MASNEIYTFENVLRNSEEGHTTYRYKSYLFICLCEQEHEHEHASAPRHRGTVAWATDDGAASISILNHLFHLVRFHFSEIALWVASRLAGYQGNFAPI